MKTIQRLAVATVFTIFGASSGVAEEWFPELCPQTCDDISPTVGALRDAPGYRNALAEHESLLEAIEALNDATYKLEATSVRFKATGKITTSDTTKDAILHVANTYSKLRKSLGLSIGKWTQVAAILAALRDIVWSEGSVDYETAKATFEQLMSEREPMIASIEQLADLQYRTDVLPTDLALHALYRAAQATKLAASTRRCIPGHLDVPASFGARGMRRTTLADDLFPPLFTRKIIFDRAAIEERIHLCRAAGIDVAVTPALSAPRCSEPEEDAEEATPVFRWKLAQSTPNHFGGPVSIDTARRKATCTPAASALALTVEAIFQGKTATKVDFVYKFTLPETVDPGEVVKVPTELEVTGTHENENVGAAGAIMGYRDSLQVSSCALAGCGGSSDASTRKIGDVTIRFPDIPEARRGFTLTSTLGAGILGLDGCRVWHEYVAERVN